MDGRSTNDTRRFPRRIICLIDAPDVTNRCEPVTRLRNEHGDTDSTTFAILRSSNPRSIGAKHMRNSERYQTSGRLMSVFGAVVLAAGCSSGRGSTPSLDVQTSYDNRTTDLSICEKSHQTCLEAADGDRPKIQTCQDERMSC